MDIRNTTPRAPPATSVGMDYSEELLAEVDEPPDSRSKEARLSWSPPHLHATFGKAAPSLFQRRESLLTRQLHSETEHTDEENISTGPARTLSTHSTWSIASTADLTSDDGHSMASPAISPPLPPTAITASMPITEKILTHEPKIIGHEDSAATATSAAPAAPLSKQSMPAAEQTVEAGLGRKRCISFACGGKDKKPPTSQPPPVVPQAETKASTSTSSPPKRKCMLKFVCPTRLGHNEKPVEKAVAPAKRAISPPPPAQRRTTSSVKNDSLRSHRGSDSTVTHSPKSTRKVPAVMTTAPTPTSPVARTQLRKLSNTSDASTEAMRFHEFGTSDDEPEEWVQESTCHRSRLTVNDTLKKENVIRRACEEVEEEAVAEDEEEEDAIDNEEGDDEPFDDEDDDDNDEEDGEDGNDEDDDEDLSDDGFHTDDEEGFAASDSEGEEEWWRPGGPSTAATSVEQLDRIMSNARLGDAALASSIGSASSGRLSPRTSAPRRKHRKHRGDAVPIQNRSGTPDLPDSTDFVCGTLDEDRPMEQAYINSIKQREAAKHVLRPQDIDPTFPTSDPELDEEDDDEEELGAAQASESENFMHGELDELDGDLTARRRTSPRSPQPVTRHRSPPPPSKRSQLQHQQHAARSPPPTRRKPVRASPTSRKLFGHSPRPARSPTPLNRLVTSSPPNTRRPSFSAAHHLHDAHHGFATRSTVTHTASLPRGGSVMLSKLGRLNVEDVDEGVAAATTADSPNNIDSPILPKRGAIDIVKGLERKRQRRKERLYAKACAKAAAKGEKAYKVKPGKGAERMREVGLELQRYHGKGEHILSM